MDAMIETQRLQLQQQQAWMQSQIAQQQQSRAAQEARDEIPVQVDGQRDESFSVSKVQTIYLESWRKPLSRAPKI